MTRLERADPSYLEAVVLLKERLLPRRRHRADQHVQMIRLCITRIAVSLQRCFLSARTIFVSASRLGSRVPSRCPTALAFKIALINVNPGRAIRDSPHRRPRTNLENNQNLCFYPFKHIIVISIVITNLLSSCPKPYDRA